MTQFIIFIVNKEFQSIMKNGNRIIWIDWAKSLCMVLVVFGHCHFQDHLLSHIIYSFHIPLFFFLSGLLFLPFFW